MDIGKIRLGSVLQSLSSDSTQKTDKKARLRSEEVSPSVHMPNQQRRDPQELKSRLREKLQRLSQESSDFTRIAPRVTVNEILLWEFGDDVLNHPEFKRIVQSLVDTIEARDDLSNHMTKLVDSLLD